MKRYCLALDLRPEPEIIAAYEAWHQSVWPEVLESIAKSGIQEMEIFRVGNRLCMLIETDDDFSFEKKAALDTANQRVMEWEELMWKFQQPLPFAGPGEKWVLMDSIFRFGRQVGGA